MGDYQAVDDELLDPIQNQVEKSLEEEPRQSVAEDADEFAAADSDALLDEESPTDQPVNGQDGELAADSAVLDDDDAEGVEEVDEDQLLEEELAALEAEESSAADQRADGEAPRIAKEESKDDSTPSDDLDDAFDDDADTEKDDIDEPALEDERPPIGDRERGPVGESPPAQAPPKSAGLPSAPLSKGSRQPTHSMSVKNYVLDTNVLLHDPQAIYRFEDNNVVIPIFVLEEIDTFKKNLSELGRNAREIARQLDAHREHGGFLSNGVPLESGGTVQVAFHEGEIPPHLRSTSKDNLILAVALEVRDRDPTIPTILVTKDVNLRIRGDALGLHTVDYDTEKIVIDELYPGTAEIEVASEDVDTFYSTGVLSANGSLSNAELVVNQYTLLRDRENPAHTALGRFNGIDVVPIRKLREGVWGIRPRNKEQHYSLDVLLNDDINLVTLVGKAGTGKTLLALAAGLQKVVEERAFQKLLVSRPIFPLGRDIGFLPGDIEEKLNPWMQPIYDNIELLMGLGNQEKKQGRSHDELFEMGFVEVEPLTYIRGRSLPNVYMIVDESQNLTPHEIKSIITRAGDGTKIVLTGDPYQIDNPYIDSSNNGLTTVVERFKGERIAAHVTLVKGERSELAELASNKL